MNLFPWLTELPAMYLAFASCLLERGEEKEKKTPKKDANLREARAHRRKRRLEWIILSEERIILAQ